MAFYYHFNDIYDLVEWSCVEDGTKALQGKKTSESLTEGLTQIFEAVLLLWYLAYNSSSLLTVIISSRSFSGVLPDSCGQNCSV